MSKDNGRRQWMSGMPSPDDNRDGIDSKPSHGIIAAIVTIAACIALVILVMHAMPYDVWHDVSSIIANHDDTSNEANANADTSANADAGTSADTVTGGAENDAADNGTAFNDAADADADATDDGETASRAASNATESSAAEPSKSVQVVKGNGWSVTLPDSWVGNVVISYSENGNRATVMTQGNGSGTDSEGNLNATTASSPYLLLIERESGSEPDVYGDIGSQLAYSVPSSDGTWHLEVWTINAVWLVRQDDQTPYTSTSEQVWDTMCNLLTGGKVKDADAARALGDDDFTIGTGEIDYLTSALKPETQVI